MATWIRQLLGSSLSFMPAILPTLRRFGEPALELAVLRRIALKVVGVHERYADLSPQIQSLNIAVDSWPAPPAGLFVVYERTVYLRSLSPMTVAHEFSHALDCALGNGVYHSEQSHEIQEAFAHAKGWITPYAATRVDEYFAESMRAYLGINDAACRWPRATRERLQRLDPPITAYLERLFREGFRQAVRLS